MVICVFLLENYGVYNRFDFINLRGKGRRAGESIRRLDKQKQKPMLNELQQNFLQLEMANPSTIVDNIRAILIQQEEENSPDMN